MTLDNVVNMRIQIVDVTHPALNECIVSARSDILLLLYISRKTTPGFD